MSYLIKAVGIDLASVSSGLAALEIRAGSWETRVVDAGAIHIQHGHGLAQTQFSQHLVAAQKILLFVQKHRPDIVGIEEYTMQSSSHVSFSIAQIGGMVRLLLWQAGYRTVLLTPSRVSAFVITRYVRNNKMPTGRDLKDATIAWVQKTLNVEYSGTRKNIEDMADATVYALLAGTFFAGLFLQMMPPMTARQMEIFQCLRPRPGSKNSKPGSGWKPTGLFDTPYRFLIRNLLKEAETHSPDWLAAQCSESGTRPVLQDVLFVGEGTPDYEL